MMRNGNGWRTFLLGTGLGVLAGVAISRWMENNSDPYLISGSLKGPEINLEKEEIAEIAQQFLNDDETTSATDPIH